MSRVLGAGANAEYREAGWTITGSGRVSAGVVAGPCARCGRLCVRYGPRGKALCQTCKDSSKESE